MTAFPVSGSARPAPLVDVTRVLPHAAGVHAVGVAQWARTEHLARPVAGVIARDVVAAARTLDHELGVRHATSAQTASLGRMAGALAAGLPAREEAPAPARRVLVVGDSVLAGAEEEVRAALAGWEVVIDARVGRFVGEGAEVLRRHRGASDPVAVVALGSNYLGDPGTFGAGVDAVLQALDGVDRVLWVTVAESGDDRWEVNGVLRASAGRRASLELVDWAPVAAARPELTWEDGLHLRPEGARVLAELVAAGVGPAPPG